MTEEAIFEAAAGKQGQERVAFLAAVCGDDDLLRGRVQELLAARDAPDPFLDRPPLATGETLQYEPVKEKPGATIGNYRLLRKSARAAWGSCSSPGRSRPTARFQRPPCQRRPRSNVQV